MARKPKTAFAILGLLSWRPMSGYDIKKVVEMALSHFWSESYGNLFPTLERLVEQGFATRTPAPTEGGRPKYLYSATAKGRRAFEQWIQEPSDDPQVRNEMLLKFFLTARRSAKESIRLLESFRQKQLQRYEAYRQSEAVLAEALRTGAAPREIVPFIAEETANTKRKPRSTAAAKDLLVFFLTLRHGILAIEGRLAWIDESIRALKRPGTRSKRGPRQGQTA